MPPKTILRELGCRNFICKSCLSNLRRTAAPARWSSSQAAQSSSPGDAAQPVRRKVQVTDDAERLKTLKKLGLLKEEEEPMVKVNYFEQGKGGQLRRLDGPEEFSGSLMDHGGEIEQNMKELEDSLGKASALMKLIEESGGKELIDDLKKQYGYGSEVELEAEADLMEQCMIENPAIKEAMINYKGFHSAARGSIARLNELMRTELRQADQRSHNYDRSKERAKLWKAYTNARMRLRTNQWHQVPAAAWNLLWDILTEDVETNRNRMSHIFTLTRDMSEAGIKLEDSQQLLAIEAMFIEGWREEAIKNFKRFAGTLGANPETFMEYWQTGLRMYCLSGDLEPAARVLEIILESPYKKDPQIFFPLIRACAANPDTVDAAYDYYHSLQSLLGPSMTLEHYDQIICYFLTANQAEHALYIFVEMMTSSHLDIRKIKKSERLPQTIMNPFFFGKWLRRLIAAGDLDGAENVISLMMQKEVRPRAMHVNGLISAWMRSGTADYAEKASRLAWRMINTRIQFVQNRIAYQKLDLNIVPESSSGGWPSANLETFSLLAENYRQRGLYKEMGDLWGAFKLCAIPADTFMLNQLLDSHLNHGRANEVWDLWHRLSNEYKVAPDSFTFVILWLALPANQLPIVRPQDAPAETARTRRLFAEMVPYARHLKDDVGFPFELARRVMHTFRKLNDRVGTLVAYRALRELFGVEDPKSLPLELVVGSTNLAASARSARVRHNMIEAAQRIEHYLSHRRRLLVEAGEVDARYPDLPPDVKTIEMANFLDFHLQGELGRVENAQELFLEAAREMGVHGDNPAGGDGGLGDDVD